MKMMKELRGCESSWKAKLRSEELRIEQSKVGDPKGERNIKHFERGILFLNQPKGNRMATEWQPAGT